MADNNRDNDIRALLLIRKAMEISTPRMRRANLDFVLSRDWSEFDRGWPQTCERVYNPLPKLNERDKSAS